MNPNVPEHLRDEAQFSDKVYSPWADNLTINPDMFRMYAQPQRFWEFRERMAYLLGDVSGKKLLDFGSGMGEEACYFAKLGANVTAIDVSPVGVNLTRRRAQENGLSMLTLQGDVLNSGLPSASFDLVHGIGILHHVGLGPGLREVHRLLKDTGRAVFAEHMSNSALVDRVRAAFALTSPAHYTEGEQPLTWKECVAGTQQFSRSELHPYFLTFRLKSLVRVFRRPLFKHVDYWILRLLPPLRFFAGGVLIYLEK